MRTLVLLGTLVLGATAGIVGGLYEPKDGPIIAASNALEYGNFRLAIAHEVCREPGQAGYNYQAEKCAWWLTRGGYCGCMTHDDEPLSHELTQAEYDALPDSYFVDMGVCEGTVEGQLRRWVLYPPYFCDSDGDCPGASTCELRLNRCIPAAGWTCSVVKRKIPRVIVEYAAAKTPIVLALRDVCCAGCAPEETCEVRPGSWKSCPFCLLDGAGACDSLCAEEPP